MSQQYSQYDDGFEPTQQSQPIYSQTQNSQAVSNSQLEPHRKYWAIFIPTTADRQILKIPWSKPFIQIGRGPQSLSKNDIVLSEKRVSNKHCRLTLGMPGKSGGPSVNPLYQMWMNGEKEPEVWIEDLKSSNGTFVNSVRVTGRRLLQQGDEISLGHQGALPNKDGTVHDVRYIYRSVGHTGTVANKSSDPVGQVYERYQVLERLGAGSFAEVYKAVDVSTGDMRAIKQIVKHRFASKLSNLQMFYREISITRSLEHENICRLIDWYEDPQHISLVLEFVDGGDLLDYIMGYNGPGNSGIPEELAAAFTLQICSAMAYTHSLGVTHRDLKPENILLNNNPNGPPTLKIADFGLAKMVHAGTMLTSMVGTPVYVAPEVMMQNEQGYENVVDSWSIGIIVYSMMTKALPFDEKSEDPVDVRIKARFTQEWDHHLLDDWGISALAIDFINRLLAKDPKERMTMKQALEHEWLAGPSSQSQFTESQQEHHRLGGDSTWHIKEFDDSSFESMPFGEAKSEVWGKPPTVSGTRIESMGGRDEEEVGEHEGSDDFSQPMTGLRLDTPVRQKPPKRISQRQALVGSSVPDLDNEIARDTVLMTPPLTASGSCTDPNLRAEGPDSPEKSMPDSSRQKRKAARSEDGGSIDEDRMREFGFGTDADGDGETRAEGRRGKSEGAEDLSASTRGRKSMRLL
ncbi:hypothetical protein B9479_000512 [Cryptococcus floricola]|uniref:CAMK protein kinase n=1 Tax=Cryptococcus floricola TaxID=2591691 RepID=A0A5D3B8J1_9TREE|nr:hypothetical protein B9479_000512 [Cryptococcus floricola]